MYLANVICMHVTSVGLHGQALDIYLTVAPFAVTADVI
jgi:hypothetical protein